MIDQPVLRELGASGRWLLCQPWECAVPGVGLLSLPAGVVTDLESTPKALHWLVDQGSLGAGAALVHDALYRHGGVLPVEWLTPYRTVTREEADEALYSLALLSGAPRWRCWVAWRAVRWFAGPAWRRAS